MSGDISIGAIGAALIAGIVSLLGLIISKEQKTSEFRQTWVDSLRSETTSYLTNFNAISDALLINYANQHDKVAALAPLYSKFNEAGYAITLRLNPDEARSKAVLACMRRFNQLAANEADMVPAKIKPIEIDFLTASKELLKYEWKRVKRGEPTFWVTKVIAAMVIIAALLSLPFLSRVKKNASGRASETAPAIINNVSADINSIIPGEKQCLIYNSEFKKSNNGIRGNNYNIKKLNSSARTNSQVCKR